MKTDQSQEPRTVFPQIVASAIPRLKEQLRQHYQQAYPSLGEIIHLVLDEEEANAWQLSPFPHLLLPDLVEAHIAKLGLPSLSLKDDDVPSSRRSAELSLYRPAFALCG